MTSRTRRPNVISADQILSEYAIDRDVKKITNAISILDRRFYDSLYPEINPKEPMTEKFNRLLAAADALKQKEKLELFLLSRDIVDT